MKTKIILLSMVIGLVSAGCSGGEEDSQPDAADTSDATNEEDASDTPETRFDLDGEPCELFEDRGPFAVGLMEEELSDGTEVAIFYPAAEDAQGEMASYDMREFLPAEDRELISDEDAPLFEMNAMLDAEASQDGPFPVVLFSHGLAGYRYQSSTLLSHLASYGFVVASAEHGERNLEHILTAGAPDGDNAPATMRAVLAHLGDLQDAGILEGQIDLDRIAATGHSMGGGGARSMLGEPGVEAVILYASGAGVEENQGAQVMWQGGTTDVLASMSQIRHLYESGEPTKRLLGIEDAGHLAFSDICAIGADRGGVLQIASDAGIDVPPLIMTLGRDGCRDTDLPVEDGWPIIHHYSVSHLRAAFGMDEEPVGLSDATVGCFEEVTELEWAAE